MLTFEYLASPVGLADFVSKKAGLPHWTESRRSGAQSYGAPCHRRLRGGAGRIHPHRECGGSRDPPPREAPSQVCRRDVRDRSPPTHTRLARTLKKNQQHGWARPVPRFPAARRGNPSSSGTMAGANRANWDGQTAMPPLPLHLPLHIRSCIIPHTPSRLIHSSA